MRFAKINHYLRHIFNLVKCAIRESTNSANSQTRVTDVAVCFFFSMCINRDCCCALVTGHYHGEPICS